jgi:molecular chaperone Hsp33
VRGLLGEAIAASVLLSATLKLEGSLILQAQSEGPVTLLVAQVSAERRLRGLAAWKDEARCGPLPSLLRAGRIVITVEPRLGRERYQSIVDLDGETLSVALDRYFEQSEQLPTRLWLAADGKQTAGLLLQEMPFAEPLRPRDPDAWNRAVRLAATLSQDELLQLPAEELLRRLYHEEVVRVFDPEPVRFHCSCSRQRIESVLLGLGYREMQETLRECDPVEVTCEFCNQRYAFDAVDIEALFAGAHPMDVTRH